MNEPLDTERLHLRPFEAEDLEAFHAIWGDPEVIWWGASESLEQTRQGFERLLARERTWPDGVGWLAIVEPSSGEVVGDVLLQPAPFVEGIEIGWHLRRDAWGRGHATEAAQAVAQRALEGGVCDALWALVAVQNTRSLAVADRLGMHFVREMTWADLPHRVYRLEPRSPVAPD